MKKNPQASSGEPGRTRHAPRNRWVARAHGGDWPLAVDLGRGIGSGRWWRGLGTLAGGLLLSLAIGLTTPAEPHRVRGGDSRITGTAAAAEATELAALDTPAPVEPASAPAAEWQPPARPLVLRPDLREEADSSSAAWRRERVVIGRGDTLMDAALRAGADRREAHAAITALRELFDPRRLNIGQAVELVFAPGEERERLVRLALRSRFDARLAAERTGAAAFDAVKENLPTTPLLDFKSGVIDDSLYLSARRAGVPVAILVELIRLYSFNVDFQREIRPGDRFELLYERRLAAEDGQVENGGVLYAKLTLRGRELPLYRYQPGDSPDVDYFNAAGESVRKALMKTPLDGARLTSRFGPRRHPVLGYVRSHKGADFGAPTGTPVYAAGDGVIERASRYGSYGNYIRIRHNSTEYKTAYAHLSGYARGIRSGVRVAQGQVIGYVGATGRVTGPHLHYEVFRGESRVDPLTLDLPAGRVLEGAALAAFQDLRARYDSDRRALAHAWETARQTADVGRDSPRRAAAATAAAAAGR